MRSSTVIQILLVASLVLFLNLNDSFASHENDADGNEQKEEVPRYMKPTRASKAKNKIQPETPEDPNESPTEKVKLTPSKVVPGRHRYADSTKASKAKGKDVA
ncbi:hypothetical protein Ddc_23144 [Ditylenchus destructor]|nr:hypothetical protein Ddc_23144 [Ditylenchus destructor]